MGRGQRAESRCAAALSACGRNAYCDAHTHAHADQYSYQHGSHPYPYTNKHADEYGGDTDTDTGWGDGNACALGYAHYDTDRDIDGHTHDGCHGCDYGYAVPIVVYRCAGGEYVLYVRALPGMPGDREWVSGRDVQA
jgi:hypothetical protein